MMTLQDVIDNYETADHNHPVSANVAKELYGLILTKMSFEVVDSLDDISEAKFYIYEGQLIYPYYILNSRWYGFRLDPDNGACAVVYNRVRHDLTVDKYISTSQIANNLYTNDEGYVLDARQGAELKESLDSFIRTTNVAIYNFQNEYVKAEAGKTLIPISDLRKIQSLDEYDDQELRDLIEDLDAKKIDKVEGKGLSSEDFTKEYKEKSDSLGSFVSIKGVAASVSSLPLSGNKIGDIYFVPNEVNSTDNYGEYIWINASGRTKWEKLGNVNTTNLEGYYNSSQIDNMISKLMIHTDTVSLSANLSPGFYNYGNILYLLYATSATTNKFVRFSNDGLYLADYDKVNNSLTYKILLTSEDIVNSLAYNSDGTRKALSQYQGYLLNSKLSNLESRVISHEKDGWEYINEDTPFPS
jgi:hypothetical protein